MPIKQEQSDKYLKDLLAQVVIYAEKSNISDEAVGEHILLAWQTEHANYKLVRRIVQLDEHEKYLSQRERQIIRLIMQGMCNRGIAHMLDISPNTVSTYIRRVFTKLEVCTRAEMVSRVLRDNLLENEANLH